ncbi:erythritol/L-threitol dehydrogenase-like [Symsagittifera roscoffensis]|uniref:erythritol/L-threitol dehydrogenase-like n=1 Tax=Symsagittifera roscoffensis TaxID=84072 RepID=UPI00307B1AF8
MKCLMFDKQNGMTELEVPVPDITSDEALVQILRVGICNTDLEILQGYSQFEGIMGHEFIGRVARLPNELISWGGVSVGQRVVGDINISCGRCHVCMQQQGSPMQKYHCPQRSVIGIRNRAGAFAEYLVLPIANLHAVHDSISDEAAVFCEPIAAAVKIIEQKLVHRDQIVCVIGDGKLGLLICEVLCAAIELKRLVLVGKYEHKMMLSGGGVEKFDHSDMTKTLFIDYFDTVIEATGNALGIMSAISMCRPMGTVVLKTTCATNDVFDSTLVVVKELKLVGSRCGPIPAALKLLKDKKINPAKFIQTVFPFSQWQKAIETAQQKGALKIQMTM